jgi:GT2 family glycosyltransferase
VSEELSQAHERRARGSEPFPPDLVLTPISRRPTRLPAATVETVLARPAPAFPKRAPDLEHEQASIVVVTHGNLAFTRLCLESVLANTDYPSYELIVVDNGSSDSTPAYLSRLAELNAGVRVVLNRSNAGFARANNQGLQLAAGKLLVLLNNDTIVPPGWLTGLASKLEDRGVGIVGPVTNRIGNEAEVEAPYRTLGGFLELARRRCESHAGEAFDIPTLTMFCLAMRREVYERIGPLDERFEVGLLEDDDYSMRVHEAGYRVLCANDVFVHHFGETSFGKLIPSGEYARLLEANKRRFEEKWGVAWQPYGRRLSARYRSVRERIRQIVAEKLPPEATLLVVSRGDEDLLKLGAHPAWHFPQDEGGVYAGHYPADGEEAVRQLEDLRARGGEFLVLPQTSLWWLDHYEELNEHLRSHAEVVHEEDACVIFALRNDARLHS